MHRSITVAIRPRTTRMVAFGALLLSASLLMGASPSPTASGPGPMQPPAPVDPGPVPTGPLFPPPSIDPLDAPSGRGPAIAMPAELVGAWYTGNVGSIGYVDPNTGAYSDGSTEGLAYTFYPDGSWQYGWMLTSSLYSCSMKVLVFRQGVLANLDVTAHIADLDTQLAQIHSEDSCVTDNNYDRELTPDDETLIWTRTTDEYGDVLLLRGPNTSVSVFRPAQG